MANHRRRRLRLVAVVAVAAVPALVVWSAGNGDGWLGDGPSYLFVSSSALAALTAAFAAVLLAVVQAFADEPFALFTSRRPAEVAVLWLVAMLAAGMGVCGVLATTQQGDTPWEPADKGWFVGWALHFVVLAGLLVLLWWIRARSVWIVAAPVLTGLLAAVASAPSSSADFRDDATFGDGLGEVLPYTFVSAFLMGLVLTLVLAGASTPPGTASPGRAAPDG